jgi:membrane-associated protease RseP (regulator of RpoE activity)
MGAVIFMEPRAGHRRALFDIGISGPLAGLVPTLIFCIVGIRLSTYTTQVGDEVNFPLLFVWLFGLFGTQASSAGVPVLHPTAFAGWVGLFITSLNLIPIGQLDGGHVLYALVRKKARYISGLLLLAIVLVVATNEKLYTWAVMLMILFIMGPFHPPTANDDEPLGVLRYIIGWATLAFVVIGFTPMPFRLR